MLYKKKPHLLIVGGTGFIGYHLAIKAIKKKWKVSSISLNNPKDYRYINKVHYIKTDNSQVLFVLLNLFSFRGKSL